MKDGPVLSSFSCLKASLGFFNFLEIMTGWLVRSSDFCFCQKSPQFSENGIFCCKFRIFEKKIRQKATENWFFGDGVATFMPTGYSFQSFFK
jgi:hypothetical protein